MEDPSLDVPDSPTKSRTILVIEDSATVRSFLRHLFAREWPDSKIVEATDGRSALHEMTRCRADLIVSDLQMPGMDGRSFIATLRSNPLLRKKCVLVLSGDDVADLRRLYASDPGIRFLRKPSGTDEIMRAAHSLLLGLPSPSLS
jgi:two-component system chemotaxis response regulator CheY